MLSSDADWSLRSTVKKLNNFLMADWDRMNLHQQTREVVRDGMVYGTGLLKPFDNNNRVQCERAIPTSVLVDDRDALYGNPKNYLQIRHIPRHTLIDAFPDSAKFIEDASTISHLSHESFQISELIPVVEAWHLPTREGEKNGRHCIVIENTTLYDDTEYDNHLGPFVVFRWITRPEGFWGIGVVDQIKGIQLQIDKLILNIARAIHFVAKPTMFIKGSSKITPEQVDNDRDRYTVIYHQGETPITQYNSGVNGELVNYLQYLFEKAYQISGVSELAASARKPAGVNSGIALRNYADITSQRFLAAESDLHDYYVNCAKQTIYHATQIANNNDYYKIEVVNGDIYTTIDWKELKRAENQYIIRPLPVSNLGHTFAGRLEKVQELMQSGLVDPQTGLELMNLPDLEKHQNLQNSSRNLARKVVEKIIDDAEYTQPSELLDIPFLYSYAKQQWALLQVEDKNIPDENLELLEQLISETTMIIEQRQAQQQAQQQPQPAPVPQQ